MAVKTLLWESSAGVGGVALNQRYHGPVATIQVRNIDEADALLLRRAAEEEGMSLQAYMRREVTALARRRVKMDALMAFRSEVASDGAGLPADFAADAVWQLRGE